MPEYQFGWNRAWNQPFSGPQPGSSGVGAMKFDPNYRGGGYPPVPSVLDYIDGGTPRVPIVSDIGGGTGLGTNAGVVGTVPNAQIADVVKGLLTPGLVPDIARQSAEISAGRGIAGSPAASSTGVRMSEQNWLQRLGLANTLLSGEAGRTLPYQITPYQQMLLEAERQRLALEQQRLQLQRQQGNRVNPPSLGGGGGGGGRYGGGTYPSGFPTSPYDTGWGSGTNNWGLGGGSSGPAGLGRTPLTLDDIYEELGFGDFGSLPGDTLDSNRGITTDPGGISTADAYNDISNWNWDWMAPPPPGGGFPDFDFYE